MSIEIKGTIQYISEVKTVGSKGFQKRSFVLQTDEKYPQQLELEITGDRMTLLDQYGVGDMVTASVNLKGRKWEGPQGTKYFNTIEAWRLDGARQQRSPGGQHEAPSVTDDVPF